MPDREHARQLLERQALDSRERAEELRTVGENTRSPEARRSLLGLAKDADAMADKIEARARALGGSNGSAASESGDRGGAIARRQNPGEQPLAATSPVA